MAAALGVVPAGAATHEPAAAKTNAPPADALYPHIYQAPLFGSLFAVSNNEQAVDESALRYYASLHNFVRANAEIKRLKALHPNWTPPTNIYSSAGAGADEQPFWDLLAADRLEELRAGIALKERKQPGWRPSRDLTTKIARKAAIEELVRDSKANKPAEALAVADRDPSVLHCAYMDADWRVAEAFLALGMEKRAFEIYHAIIATCPDHDERLATVRKAISRFSFAETEQLIAMGAKSADGASEFDAAKLDLTRARIVAANQGKAGEPIAQEALNAFFAEVGRTKAPADLALAGWFEYNRAHFDKAERWFSLARLGAPAGADAATVNLAEGRALSLLKLGRVEEAAKLAYIWRDVSKTLRGVYLGATASLLTQNAPPAKLSEKALAEFTDFVESERSFVGASALGWRRFNFGQYDDAVDWFKTALAWRSVDPSQRPGAGDVQPDVASAVEGYGRALSRVGRMDEAARIADLWRGGGPTLRALFLNLMSAAVDAAPSTASLNIEQLGHYAEVVSNQKIAAAAAGFGWLAYRSADDAGAIAWFRKALAWSQGRGDLASAQGLALSLKRAGQFAEAEDVAWGFARESRDMRAIYVSAVIAELASDKANVPPRRLSRFVALVAADRSAAGARALGWRRLKEGNCYYAAPWFRKAAAWSAARNEDAGTARGLALALKNVGAYAEAEDVAYAWRDRDPQMRALYVDIGVAALTSETPKVRMREGRLARLAQFALAERNVAAARALGWHRYNQAGCGYGGQWLILAVAWGDPANRDAKTDEGLGLALRATGRLAEAAELARPWVDKAAPMKKLYIDAMAEELSRDNPPEPIDEERLKAFVEVIGASHSPLGAQALGWYRFERGEAPEAARWFKNALDWWPAQRRDLSRRLSAPGEDYKPLLAKLALFPEDYRRTPLAYPNTSATIGKARGAFVDRAEGLAKTEEGYVLALRALGRFEEAETIAWAWRDRSPSLKAQFVAIAVEALSGKGAQKISRPRLERYAAAIEEARSGPAAQAFAWRALKAQAPEEAARWFEKALAWSPRRPPDPGLVEGYVEALQAQRKFDEADKLATRWRAASPRFEIVYLQAQIRGLSALGSHPETSARYAAVAAQVEKARLAEGALSLAWLAYEGKDYERARAWFRRALDWGGAADKAKEGVALTLRAEERFDELAAFGYAERALPAVRAVYFGGMIAWLTADKPVRDVGAKPLENFEAAVGEARSVSGAQALAWGASLRQQWPQARRWFESAIGWSDFDPLKAPAKPAADRAKLIEGYVAALRASGDGARAEEIAFAWRDAAPALGALYLQIFAQALADDSAPLTAERISRFESFVEAHRAMEGAAALGWRFYRAKSAGEAASWFERALAFAPEGPPPKKIAQGYVLSLGAAGRREAAEDYAYALVKDPDMRALYVSAVVAQLADDKAKVGPARLARFAAVVLESHSGVGARALGWRRLKGDNCVYAAPWFRKAAAWSLDGAQDGEAARGLALALQKAGAFDEAEDIAYAWRGRAPAMDRLFVDIGVDALSRAIPDFGLSEARMVRLSERVLALRHVKGARALAWRRYAQAACGFGGEWFRRAMAWNDAHARDAKTDEGYGQSLRAVGRLADAAEIAHPWVDKVPLMKKLYIDTLVEELSRDNPPQPVDEARLKDFVAVITPVRSALGAQALGWYRLERGEYDEAGRWFQFALDWWPPQRADKSKRLSAPVEDYKPLLAKLALKIEDYRRTPRAYPNSSALIGARAEDYVNTEEGLAKTEEGYVQALRALGRAADAEAIAWKWRDRWPGLRALFLDIAVAELSGAEAAHLPAERLTRYQQAIVADRFVAGAAALAWRDYRLSAFDAAADWFGKAIDWTKGPTPPRSLVEGYVMALQGAKKFDAASAAAAKWRAASPDLNLVFVRSELQRLRASGKAATLKAEDLAEYEKSLAGSKSADGALSLAWVAYDAHDYDHALTWFRKAGEWGAAAKAKEGVALSLRALERWEELASFGYPERKTSPVLHDVYFAGMIAWLTSDKPLLRMDAQARAQFEQAASEERSATAGQALAWGALMRGEQASARQWFETAMGWSGFDPLAPQGPLDAARAKLVEGYVQALRAVGDLARAEDIAYVWRDAGPALAGLYLQVFTQELASDDGKLDASRVARFAAVAEAKRSSPAAGALGWRAYRAKTYADALSWFAKAIDWSPGHAGDAKIDEGYALTLRAAGRLVEAEDFAWAHRDLGRAVRAAYVAAFSDQLLDAKLSPGLSPLRLARFSAVVTSDRISAGAAALGWRRLKDGPCGYSAGWFRKAIAWSEKGADLDKLYSGYAQALRAVGMYNEAEDAAFTYAGRSPEAHELYVNIVIEELTREWPRTPMNETRIGRFTGAVLADRSAKGAQALGWRRYMQAGGGYGGRWFELAAAWSADKTGDAHLNEGYALSMRAVGRLKRAEEIAYPWIERAPAMKKLYIDNAVEELSRDYPPEPIPEARVAMFESVFLGARSPLGAQALGWYRFARGEYDPAAKWFENALAWWPPLGPDADQKLAAPVDDYHALLAHLAFRIEDYRRTPRAYPNSSLLIGRATDNYVHTALGLAKTVEGYVRTLIALKRYDQAEALGFRWLDRWPPLRGVLIELAAAELAAGQDIAGERLDRFSKLIEAARSVAGAEAFGWRAYKAKDYAGAARWLKQAVDWRPADSAPSLDVARAYADSLSNLKQYDEALKFLAVWRARMPGLAATAAKVGLASLSALDADPQALRERLKAIVEDVAKARSVEGAQSLGWLAYSRKEFAGAEAWFKQAILWTPAGGAPDQKALEGYARALQGERRFADFMRFTEQWSQRVPALKPLFLEAAAQAIAAAAGDGEDLPTALLAEAGKAFAEARSVNGAQALAWQRVSQRDWTTAAAWFRAALGWSNPDHQDPKIVEGLVTALRNLHKYSEAETLAYEGGQRDEALRGLYIEMVSQQLTAKPPAPPGEAALRRFAGVVLAAQSAAGAEALGWYSYNSRQYPAAAAWFEKALAFAPSENAAYGLALAYRKARDGENYRRVVDQYRDAYAKLADLTDGRRPPRERRAALEDEDAPRRTPTASRAATDGSGTGSSSALGWRLLHQNRPAEAARAFEDVLRTATGKRRQDATYGRALALLSLGDGRDAGQAAGEGELNAGQRNQIGVQLLERRAWDAYDGGRYDEALAWLDRRRRFVSDSRALMQLRVWCLTKLGRADAAAAIQAQLDQQLSQ